MFVILVAATIVVAACSWHLYEKPLNDLKRRFDFRFLAPERPENGPVSDSETVSETRLVC